MRKRFRREIEAEVRKIRRTRRRLRRARLRTEQQSEAAHDILARMPEPGAGRKAG